MSEKAPKPSAESGESFESKEVVLMRAGEISEYLKQHDYQEVDSETNAEINTQQAELYRYMMRSDVSWNDCVKHKLPWDPRFEMHKKQRLEAANKSRPPAAEEAA